MCKVVIFINFSSVVLITNNFLSYYMYVLIYCHFNSSYASFKIPSLIALTWTLQKLLESCKEEGGTKWK